MGDEMETSRPAKAELILDAALRVLATDGYSGITIAKVAEEAKVSRGLLHYYFQNKEDMLIQLMNRSGREAWNMMGSLVAKAGSAEQFADMATKAMRDFSRTQGASLVLLVEVMAVARTNARIQQAFAEIYRESQREWTEQLLARKKEGQMGLTLPEGGLATILKAVTYGMGLTLNTVPAVAKDEETWVAFRELLFRAVS
jgi:AcrR family transcriptional regulator